MIFKIQILAPRVQTIRFALNFLHLSISIIEVTELPGPIPIGDPDTEVTLECLGDPSEIFYLADFARQQRQIITIK